MIAITHLGHEREPRGDLMDRFEIVLDDEVAHAVTAHHLRPAELKVALVHVGAQQLVQSEVAGEDDRRVLLLDDALAEAEHVRANADVARRAVRECEDLAVRHRRLGRDARGALEALDTEAILDANDCGDLVVRRGHLLGVLVLLDRLRAHSHT